MLKTQSTRADLMGALARDAGATRELTVFMHHQHVGEVRLRQHITPQHRSGSSVESCNSTRLTRHIPVQREWRQCADMSERACACVEAARIEGRGSKGPQAREVLVPVARCWLF